MAITDVRKFEHVSEDRGMDREETLVDFEEVRISGQNDISVGKPEKIVTHWYFRCVIDVHGDGGKRQRDVEGANACSGSTLTLQAARTKRT